MAHQTVEQQFSTVGEFKVLLAAAELEARSAWEIDFTTDMRARFNQYGVRTQLSNFQRQALERLSKQ